MDVLGAPISVLEKTAARKVEREAPLKEAARALRDEKAGRCLVFEGMVVAP